MPLRRPAPTRAVHTPRLRPRGPLAHGQCGGQSGPAHRPRVASSPLRSRRPGPQPSPLFQATAPRKRRGAPPRARGLPRRASCHRRPTAGRVWATLSAYAPCWECLSHPRLVPPPAPPSHAAAPRGPTTPASLGAGAESAPRAAAPPVTPPLLSPREAPSPWWPHRGARPEAMRTPPCGAQARPARAQAQRSAGARAAAAGPTGHHGPPVER